MTLCARNHFSQLIQPHMPVSGCRCFVAVQAEQLFKLRSNTVHPLTEFRVSRGIGVTLGERHSAEEIVGMMGPCWSRK